MQKCNNDIISIDRHSVLQNNCPKQQLKTNRQQGGLSLMGLIVMYISSHADDSTLITAIAHTIEFVHVRMGVHLGMLTRAL